MYAGNLNVGSPEERELYNRLHEQPARVERVQVMPAYDARLVSVIEALARTEHYATFAILKEDVRVRVCEAIPEIGQLHLTTLFGGIYIGNPEHLKNYLNNAYVEIWYPIKGFCSKVLDAI